MLAIDNSTALSQSNIANIFSAENYSSLTSLIGGTSTNYVTSSSNGAVIPSTSSAPSSPAVGQIWYNSSANAYQYWNGTAVQQVGFTGTGGTSTVVSSQWTTVSGGINYGSGNVGIGTATPGNKLDVAGNVNANAYLINGGVGLAQPSAYSVAVGTYASNTGSQVAIGVNSLGGATGADNTAVGPYSSPNMSTGQRNTSVGRTSLYANQTGSENTGLGYYSLYLARGNYNTAVGSQAGTNLNSVGDSNVFVGYYAGGDLTTGSNNIIIGTGAEAASNTGSYQLSIGNVIYGDLTNSKIGIGTSAPAATLDVKGHIGNSATGTPALSSCGSATISGNDTRGLIQGSPPDGCVITFNTAYATSPFCTLTRFGAAGTVQSLAISAISTTSFTYSTSGPVTGFFYMCIQ